MISDTFLVRRLGKESNTGLKLLIIKTTSEKCEIASFSENTVLIKNKKLINETYKVLSIKAKVLYLKFLDFVPNNLTS